MAVPTYLGLYAQSAATGATGSMTLTTTASIPAQTLVVLGIGTGNGLTFTGITSTSFGNTGWTSGSVGTNTAVQNAYILSTITTASVASGATIVWTHSGLGGRMSALIGIGGVPLVASRTDSSASATTAGATSLTATLSSFSKSNEIVIAMARSGTGGTESFTGGSNQFTTATTTLLGCMGYYINTSRSSATAVANWGGGSTSGSMVLLGFDPAPTEAFFQCLEE